MKFEKVKLLLLFLLLIQTTNVFSQMNHSFDQHFMSLKECDEMSVWDYQSSSCMPLPMENMPMSMWMIHGNFFGVQSFEEGSRGRNNFSSPNMLMGDVGKSLGSKHYINLDLMLTFEKWTYPEKGYPELLQIGEEDKNHRPYIDAQHPHSTPLMGVTLSDTIKLKKEKDFIKIFFAPRGEATEGPVPFMHRQTGMVNPDAPLGHHIGQDVAHVSSTVLGSSLKLSNSQIEISTFNGTEPEPSKVDLPLGKWNSFAGRYIYEFNNYFYAMASASYVKNPEPHNETIKKINRYSASFYHQLQSTESSWMLHNSFIFGYVTSYDNFSNLKSFNEEFLFHSNDLPHNFWGRIEILERGNRELNIDNSEDKHWVQAFTFGYTYDFLKKENYKVGIGSSVSEYFVPAAFESSYGKDPLAVKIFIQLTAMKMGDGSR